MLKILEYTCEDIASHFERYYGKGLYHAAALCREIFQKGNANFDSSAPEFRKSPQFARTLKEVVSLNLAPVIRTKREAGVIKFITRLPDGVEVESVIVPMARHKTLCISTQAGCRMGCRFCETARLGFIRDLTVEEIVSQVFTGRFVFDQPIKNVVFMGMGEPTDNWGNVAQAMKVMNDQKGLDIAMSHMTLSTVGTRTGLLHLAELNQPRLNLAISLNAPNDRIRSHLMPANRKFTMVALRQALLNYPLRRAGAFFMEYVLIKGVNDAKTHAEQLADYLKPLRTKVNLIPYNPGPEAFFQAPSEAEVDQFVQWLTERKVFVRKRRAKGRSVMAACGQLGNRSLT